METTFRARVRAVLLAAGALLLLAGPPAAPPARAQGADAEMFYPHLWRNQRGPVVRPPPPRIIRRQPARSTAPAARRETAAPAVKIEASHFVVVLGDSLGIMAGQGLQRILQNRPDIGVVIRARDSSGLVRDDFYDWPKAVHDLLASDQRIDAAVLMVGSNDRQALRDEAGVHEPFTPRWNELYTARVEAVAAAFKQAGKPLIWIGLPIMRSERYAADMQALNRIFRETAESHGAIFIDVWDRFAGEDGQFDPVGPGVNGQNVRLRAADGIHFTRAGAEKLAHFLDADIRRLIENAAPPAGPSTGSPADTPERLSDDPQTMDVTARIRAAIEAERRLDSTRPDFLGITPPPDIAPQVIVPTRPAAGPVTPLNAPSLSPGGLLATPLAARASGAGEAEALARRVLVEGRPAEAKPGRADDFSWPRR